MSMIGPSAVLIYAALVAWPAVADELRCHSVNGNVTCAGSGGASCQTVNGRTTCQSGNGAVVQSFGQGHRDEGRRDEGRRDQTVKTDDGAAHRRERLIGQDWDDEQD